MSAAQRGVGLPLLVGNVVLALAFWASGVALLLRQTAGAVVAGVLVLILAVVISLGVVANVAMRRFPAGLPLPRQATWGGETGVRIPAWGLGAAITPVITVLAGVAGTLLGIGALLGGRPLFGIIALPAGLYLLYLSALLLTGRVPLRQGVWLTPTRLVVCQSGTTTEVAWDDLQPVTGSGVRSLVTGRGGRLEQRRTNALGVRRPTGSDEVVVDHARLAVPAEGLVVLAARYADDPSSRAGLGGAEGVQAVRREAYDVLGGQHPAQGHPARHPG